MDRPCEQWGSLKENRNYKGTYNYNEKKTAGISGIHRGLENLTLTGHIEDKKSRGKQWITYYKG